MTSCYVRLSRDVDVHALFEERYADEPFVELATRPPGVRDVRDTNICRIHVHADERSGRVLVFSVIDNLWKGAASQAVQNLNLMLGLDETAGLG
jgi:N-acetyl-gamma-glutamyl-phosphate reductase